MKSSTPIDKIHTYYRKAMDSIPADHPHYAEIHALLIDQVNDELHDATYTRTDR